MTTEEAKRVCRTYASLMIALVVLIALITGVLSGAAFIGPPEPNSIAPAILAAVAIGWLAAGQLARALTRGGYFRSAVIGAALALLALCAAAIWSLRVAGVHAVVGGLVLGVGVQWVSRHREAA